MPLLLKLLPVIMLLITTCSAQAEICRSQSEDTDYTAQEETLIKFVEKTITANPNISDLSIKVQRSIPIKESKGWRGVLIEITGKERTKKDETPFNIQNIFFTNGQIIARGMIDMKTGINLKERLRPKPGATQYRKSNLLYGNADAKHKVIIFSDPFCSHCQRMVPEMIAYIKQYPETFALYYYQLPRVSINPASITLVKAIAVAMHMGKPGAVVRAYEIDISPTESDQNKIIAAFNKTTGLNITLEQTQKETIEEQISFDNDTASLLLVVGTPTLFFDGQIDNSNRMYKDVKIPILKNVKK